MKNLIPETPKINEVEELTKFFHTEISKIGEKFPYRKEDIQAWKDWHNTNELIEKLIDPKRFFSIIRNNNGEIIGIFESKPHSIEANTHTVQWILIQENYQNQDIGSRLWYDFLLFCKKKDIQKIIIFIHQDNIPSIMLNQKFGAKIIDHNQEEGILTLEKVFTLT